MSQPENEGIHARMRILQSKSANATAETLQLGETEGLEFVPGLLQELVGMLKGALDDIRLKGSWQHTRALLVASASSASSFCLRVVSCSDSVRLGCKVNCKAYRD